MLGLIPRNRTLDVDRFFEDFWQPLDVFRRPTLQSFIPKLDVSDTGEAVEVTVELPGLTEKDIDISLKDRVLTIQGEKKEEKKTEEKGYYLLERSYGSFNRHVHLPEQVDSAKIKAEFNSGVLHVTIPKTPESKPRKIEIKS